MVSTMINYKVPNPVCDLYFVTEGSRRCQIRNIMSKPFAFGGSNLTLIVGKYELVKA